MSPTDHIAKLLGLSGPQAVAYCEQVRRLSGLGPKLYYQLIYNQLKLEKPPYPNAEKLAKAIQRLESKHKSVPTHKPKAMSRTIPKNTQREPNEKINFYVRHEVEDGIPDNEPFVNSRLPKGVKPYSYLDYQRVTLNNQYDNQNSKNLSLSVSNREKSFIKGECVFPNTLLPQHTGKQKKHNKKTAKGILLSEKTYSPVNSKPDFELTKENLSRSENTVPSTLKSTDYGMYKCSECGKIVMGFAKESHKHQGRAIEWTKIGG